jgi:L-2-hydroxyglutarate oxidase LhgO
VIADEASRGLPGFYDLIGIESPGLTAAPAIAEHVAALLEA